MRHLSLALAGSATPSKHPSHHVTDCTNRSTRMSGDHPYRVLLLSWRLSCAPFVVGTIQATCCVAVKNNPEGKTVTLRKHVISFLVLLSTTFGLIAAPAANATLPTPKVQVECEGPFYQGNPRLGPQNLPGPG